MASSTVVRPTPKGPQMFICFHGPDVRSNFISFLNHALRKANIKVFIDEDELLSNDVKNLLTRIEESEIALVVFTEAFTTSYWCLDQLAKIEERRNQGRLKVIPIFYKVQRSDVRDLRSTFGDNFRDLRRSYLHQPKRIEKWEEAFKKIPELIGMPLLEQSERTDNDFITKLVSRIQELLEQMALEEKQETDVQYMASYSSGVAKISKGPQVFINFQGRVMHNSFIVNLAAALKDANISYSIGKEEVQNMLVRIEESRVALMIFTKEYTNSVRCLNELVKIKECIDKGTLTGIHIYYELKTSITKNLEGDFGNNFVKTKQYYQQQDLERTLKWEKALKSLTGIKGLMISETSEKSERELIIESIVDKVKSSLYDFDQKQKKSEITHSDNPKHRTGSSTEEPLKNSSLATIPRPVRPVPHRVFINYCNEPSHTFIKHLLSQLEESKINYFIFENLKKGTPYSQRLKIIEESVIALVIFSKRYTQSTRCLDELVKIEERVKNRKLKVFTVYVNVTQTEAMMFGKEFEAMTERLKIESEKVKKWKDAVRYFADIASLGWNEGNRSINNKHPNDITDKDLACRTAQTVKMELLENYPFIRLSGEKSREKSGKTEKFIYYFLKSGISALVFSCLLSKLVFADWNLSFILALLISLWHFFEA